MSLKFSLSDLLILIGAISVACAALANSGIWWHSFIVSATLVWLTGLLIWGVLNSGESRAFAAGWLLFACGYLALLFGPWTNSQLGPHLLSSKGLALLEARALANRPSPPVFSHATATTMDVNGRDLYVSDVLGYAAPVQFSPWGGAAYWSSPATASISTFQSTGHWLLATVLGFLGGKLARLLRAKN